ncbi:hydroxyacylglutathione hydrolase isoform X1 [Vidua chalybeata]|uniref:hydroxyacylglutathione hydrolase isoform X1 n=1 Tax=Vidua chalybeata TaxID=81927 RepID=UPI0023A7A9E8|nr:hydroxyacylglutathione hydrolase isoform X1 [Vidua chalybeata]
MKVKVISVLEDNYMYLVIEESTRRAVAVDAAVPKRLLEIIRKEDVELRAILTTHHHWDHARGNEELAQLLPGLQVFGADERIGALTHRVSHGQELAFGSIRVRCLFTPCHTSGHMCYFMWEDDSPDAPALFSGDTLFVGGCGQFFEGTAEQMHTNLTQILGALPKDTKVFCGHECTVRNLKFALKVEPENEMVKEKLAWAKHRPCSQKPAGKSQGRLPGQGVAAEPPCQHRVGPPLSPGHSRAVPLQGGGRAEVHGQDGPRGGAEGAALPEGQLQEAQGEAQPPGHAGLRLGALRALPGQEVTPPWCQGSLLAVPSSAWLPAGAGFCLLAACVRLLCSAPLPSGSWDSLWSSWVPLESPGCGTPPWCWDAGRGSGRGSGQGTVPVLGSVGEVPWQGAREGQECSGIVVLCPTEHQAPLPGPASQSQGL